MNRKVLALMLALLMAFSLLPISGVGAHTKTVYLETEEREYQNGILGRYTSFAYDKNGNLTKEDRRVREDHNLTSFDSRTEYSYAYNPQGDMIRMEYRNNDELVSITENQYTYTDQSTKRAVYVHPISIDVNLTQYQGANETVYDAAGNEIRVLDYDSNDRLQNRREFAYDANGNRISEMRYGYNSSGEVTATGQTLYEYDTKNRLVHEYDTDYPEENWITYTYDSSGRLAKKEWSHMNGTGGGAVYPFTTVYTYDRNGNLSSETTSKHSRSADLPFIIVTNTVRIDYVYTAFEISVPSPFKDVESDGYYRDAVEWAVENGMTNGTSKTTFSPNNACSRAETVTFLWRANGCPEPKNTSNPFKDVKENAYYYKAVLWAVENGITNGTSATTFSPEDPCTRAHVVTFLWRSANKPTAGSTNPFKDVKAGQYYTGAVLWAVSKNITDGTSATTFSPDSPCTRGQIVTFLYREKGQ